jgi:hypothetical protein
MPIQDNKSGWDTMRRCTQQQWDKKSLSTKGYWRKINSLHNGELLKHLDINPTEDDRQKIRKRNSKAREKTQSTSFIRGRRIVISQDESKDVDSSSSENSDSGEIPNDSDTSDELFETQDSESDEGISELVVTDDESAHYPDNFPDDISSRSPRPIYSDERVMSFTGWESLISYLESFNDLNIWKTIAQENWDKLTVSRRFALICLAEKAREAIPYVKLTDEEVQFFSERLSQVQRKQYSCCLKVKYLQYLENHNPKLLASILGVPMKDITEPSSKAIENLFNSPAISMLIKDYPNWFMESIWNDYPEIIKLGLLYHYEECANHDPEELPIQRIPKHVLNDPILKRYKELIGRELDESPVLNPLFRRQRKANNVTIESTLNQTFESEEEAMFDLSSNQSNNKMEQSQNRRIQDLEDKLTVVTQQLSQVTQDLNRQKLVSNNITNSYVKDKETLLLKLKVINEQHNLVQQRLERLQSQIDKERESTKQNYERLQSQIDKERESSKEEREFSFRENLLTKQQYSELESRFTESERQQKELQTQNIELSLTVTELQNTVKNLEQELGGYRKFADEVKVYVKDMKETADATLQKFLNQFLELSRNPR